MATAHGGPLAAVLLDLQQIFGERLLALAAYGRADLHPAPSLALVRNLTARDLDECAARVASWHRGGCATPLLLTMDEFAGSLDAFPIEYGEILDTYRLIFGADPFVGLTIGTEDLRRECETLVKSHLVHLRENYIECRGRPREVSALIHEAAPAFARMLRRLAALDGADAGSPATLGAWAARRPGLDPRTVGDVLALADGHGSVDPLRLYPAYLDAVERLWSFIDQWRRA